MKKLIRKAVLCSDWAKIASILILIFIGSLLPGCEYQTETKRRIAIFYAGENDGEVSKSRDIGSFTHVREDETTKKGRNAVDKWLYKNIDTSSRSK